MFFLLNVNPGTAMGPLVKRRPRGYKPLIATPSTGKTKITRGSIDRQLSEKLFGVNCASLCITLTHRSSVTSDVIG